MTDSLSHYPLSGSSWDEQEIDAIHRVIASNNYTMGLEVAAFEQEFAAFVGSKHAVMVNSGSSANLLAIFSLLYHPDKLLRPGDEVLVPAVSWSTTFFPVHQSGLFLRFVDVDRDTLNIDLEKMEKAVTAKTRAVFAVNLLGNPNDFVRLQEFCKNYKLVLIEDNCESLGATLNGKMAGTFGLCGTFSTFFSHHISTMEGGIIVTDDTALYHTLLSLRAHGWIREQPSDSHLQIDASDFVRLFRFVLPGFNVRPLEMSGAIGRAQLKKLPNIIEVRRRNATLFKKHCGDIEGIRIQKETGVSSWFGFSVLLEGRFLGQREDLVNILVANGIECRPVVSGDFTANPVIRHLNHTVGSTLEVAESVDKNGLFIGNHHFDLSDRLSYVGAIIREFSSNLPR